MDENLSKYRDIFDKKTFCHVATVGKDGTPQVTPVWCEFDGDPCFREHDKALEPSAGPQRDREREQQFG